MKIKTPKWLVDAVRCAVEPLRDYAHGWNVAGDFVREIEGALADGNGDVLMVQLYKATDWVWLNMSGYDNRPKAFVMEYHDRLAEEMLGKSLLMVGRLRRRDRRKHGIHATADHAEHR